ncbi:MAG: alkaline phosphatase family protein [Bacteroidota bacterium]|nr:alkaline phosphatase family protein [Bacteroidota bacterium]
MNKFLRSLIGILTITVPGMAVEATGATPRLVVGIHIDQLRTDYLDWFKDGFSEDGLKKMLQNGIVYRSINYDYPNPDAASATASIVTGASPSRHGIIASRWFDRASHNVISCVFDPSYLGNYTSSTASPKYLIATTLGDELKDATNNQSKVFSIGISAESAIVSGGHKADGVFWMDDNSGQWCTSTFYNYMPWWMQRINDQENQSGTMDQTAWQPLYPLNFYRYMPYQTNPTLFEYWLGKYGKDKFKAFKETPMANAEVCKIGLETIEKEHLGTDDIPDYLILNLNASGYLENSKKMSAVETQDIYFRLDQEIGKVIDAVDRQVGLENALIYIVGTGAPKNPATDAASTATYGGDFYPDRCTSLLNLYLMAIYGDEKWVSGYYNQQIYLNRTLIDKKKIDFDEISTKASEFLGEFSGVQRVIRNRQFVTGSYDSSLNSYRKGLFPAHSGDFRLDLQPGWNIRNDNQEKDLQVRYEAYTTSMIVYGANLKAQTITRPVSSSDIATTLSKVFKIRPPNASEGSLLKELTN